MIIYDRPRAAGSAARFGGDDGRHCLDGIGIADRCRDAASTGGGPARTARACQQLRERGDPGSVRGALAPGNTHTPLTAVTLADPEIGPLMEAVPVPAGRWAEPDEIA